MSKKNWPAFVKSACNDAWLDSVEVPEREEQIDMFAIRWGGFGIEAFKGALTGDAEDRLFAIFALGYLAPSDIGAYLIPFLQSPLCKERWASAIVLGRCQYEGVLPSLLNLLQENLSYRPPFDYADYQQAHLIENEKQKMEKLDRDYQQEYDWLFIHRLRITLSLLSWQDARIVPLLINSFHSCLNIELIEVNIEVPDWVYDYWHMFQDYLAYVLGQKGAWNAPDSLKLSPERLHIMRMYMVYGLLHAKTPLVFYGYNVPLTDVCIENVEQINNALNERFSLAPKSGLHYFQQFIAYYEKRANYDKDKEIYERISASKE